MNKQTAVISSIAVGAFVAGVAIAKYSSQEPKRRRRRRAQSVDSDELGSVERISNLNPEDFLVSDSEDTAIGGESLYLTQDDELATGASIRLSHREFVQKVKSTHHE